MRHGSSGTSIQLCQLAVSSHDRPLYLYTRPAEGQGRYELAGFWRWGVLHQTRSGTSDVVERRVSDLAHRRERGVPIEIRHASELLK